MSLADDADDAPDPVVGLHGVRTFRVSADGRLLPVAVMTNDWATGACIAHCTRGHQAPDLNCTCGIYSFTSWRELRSQYPVPSRRLIAVVALEGVTVQGTRGYRSQAGRVVDVWLRPGRQGLPAVTVALLRANYPGVRFHDELPELLARHPGLPDPSRPRRELLRRGLRDWWDRVHRAGRPTVRRVLAVLAAVLLATVAAVSVSTMAHPALGGTTALTLSAVGASMVFLLVIAEIPLQVAVFLRTGVSPPLQFLARRPAGSVGRIGVLLAVAGGLACLAHHDTDAAGSALPLVVGWTLMMVVESFATAVAPTPMPVPTTPPGEGPIVRPHGVAPAPPTSRRRWDHRGVVPVIVTVPGGPADGMELPEDARKEWGDG